MAEETTIPNIRPSQVRITPLVGEELSPWSLYKVFFVYREQDLTFFEDQKKFKGAVALVGLTKNPTFGMSIITGHFDQYIAFEDKDDAMIFKIGM